MIQKLSTTNYNFLQQIKLKKGILKCYSYVIIQDNSDIIFYLNAIFRYTVFITTNYFRLSLLCYYFSDLRLNLFLSIDRYYAKRVLLILLCWSQIAFCNNHFCIESFIFFKYTSVSHQITNVSNANI